MFELRLVGSTSLCKIMRHSRLYLYIRWNIYFLFRFMCNNLFEQDGENKQRMSETKIYRQYSKQVFWEAHGVLSLLILALTI